MTKKKMSRDILDDLLTGSHEHTDPRLDELGKLIKREMKIRKQPPKPAKARKRAGTKQRRAKGTKRKTTHYLSEEVFENLDEAREKLQEMLPESIQTHVSKSGIVNSALKMLLNDLELRGKSSALARQIIRDKRGDK